MLRGLLWSHDLRCMPREAIAQIGAEMVHGGRGRGIDTSPRVQESAGPQTPSLREGPVEVPEHDSIAVSHATNVTRPTSRHEAQNAPPTGAHHTPGRARAEAPRV